MSGPVSHSKMRSRSSSNSSDNTVRAAPDDPPCHKKPIHEQNAAQPEIVSLWIHDDNFCKDEVLVNPDAFQHINLAAGDLVQIMALRSTLGVRDFEKSCEASLTESNHPLDQTDTSSDEEKISSPLSSGHGG